jgi:hypothetical protein
MSGANLIAQNKMAETSPAIRVSITDFAGDHTAPLIH